MRKSIYDILGKEINYYNEYEKLYEMFNNEKAIKYDGYHYSWADIFDKFIRYWQYRSVYNDVEEILEYLGLEDAVYKGQDVMEQLLILIDFILNACEYVQYKSDEHSRELFDLGNDRIKSIFIENDMLLDNIKVILKKLKYKTVKKESYKIMLMKDEADATSTALMVADDNISDLIMDYNDFRIENDLIAKKDILVSLGQYIEPLRKEIKVVNPQLEDYIFFCLNKLHIRHNNKSGKEKMEYVSKMKNKDLIAWYDKVYDLILIAIRLIELPNSFKEFKELKKEIIKG